MDRFALLHPRLPPFKSHHQPQPAIPRNRYLQELGVAYDTVNIAMDKMEHKSPEFVRQSVRQAARHFHDGRQAPD